MTVITPTVRTTVKRTAFWSIVVAVAIAVGMITLFAQGMGGVDGAYLSPTSAAPVGAMAVAEVLSDQGVNVVIVDTEGDAQAALEGTDATLLFYDDAGFLPPESVPALIRMAAHTVVVDPGFSQLRKVAASLSSAGSVEGKLEADCSLGAVTRAGTVTGDGLGYRLIDADGTTADNSTTELCLGSGDDIYSLVRMTSGDGVVTVLGASAALTNEQVAEEGNAALALGLLGENHTLVWYQPSYVDAADATVSIADLTPAWLSPVLALLILTTIAAGLWQGRRMGPLVVEQLPVTVPANETIDGRARLYQKSSSRLRALDALRVGTIARLATAVGLAKSAGVAEVAGTVASLTGMNLHEIRHLLVEAEPTSDGELIRLSDALLTLESTVSRHIRPGQAQSPPTPRTSAQPAPPKPSEPGE